MKARGPAAIALALAALAAPAASCSAPPPQVETAGGALAIGPVGPIVIVDATVIDVRTGTASERRTLVIDQGRIASIAGSLEDARAPRGSQVVDAAGMYLIPGLWDVDADIADPALLDLLVCHGVTSARDGSGALDRTLALRQQVSAGDRIGPRLLASAALGATEARAAEAEVDALLRRGADLVLTPHELSAEAYAAFASRARRRRLRFGGHVPAAVTVREAAAAQHDAVTGLCGIALAATGDREERLRERFAQRLEQAAGAEARARVLAELHEPPQAVLTAYDQASVRAIAESLVTGGTACVPRLAAHPAAASGPLAEAADRWLPPSAREARAAAGPDEQARAGFAHHLQLVSRLREAGATVLPGTGPIDRGGVPGVGVHEELALLVRAGHSPIEALRAATLRAAEHLGQQREAGTVEVGKRADMILLTHDPRLDIRHTRRIAGVIVAGRFLSPTSIEARLRRLERTFAD